MTMGKNLKKVYS